jgi:uncharacterized protein (TIGR04255 family)
MSDEPREPLSATNRGDFQSPFPDSPRSVYRINPLHQVVAQLRFPPILLIDAEPPAPFQEELRHHYPVYREGKSAESAFPLPPELAQSLGSEFRITLNGTGKIHEFTTESEDFTITLRRDSISLTATKYREWLEFKPRLAAAVEALDRTYAPSFYTRIGLRYINAICQSELGTSEEPWSVFLSAPIAGELVVPDVARNTDVAARELLVKLGKDGSRVRVRHGLGLNQESRETCYIVDSDFFIEERKDAANAFALLDDFNRHAGRLFRWCITDQLHERLGPQ